MKATIDRIEGTVAVLIPREDESVRVNIPVSLLPPGCREGDILTIRIERDRAATEAAQERVSGLIEKLKKRK
ncbi:MAG TPA: DUF3006 domain-containing protein [Methanoregula sp.]|nr:DUF3006 domain-containing protein [Methanoregula sp.]